MSPLPRAECPVCGRSVPVRRNGTLREHKAEPMARMICEWSGRKP